MESFVDKRDFHILEDDKYTFSVLRCIMGEKCELLLTDHERLIICSSRISYPIWIWTLDDASEEEMERAYRIVAERYLLDGTHRFNLKYDLAEFFMRKASEDGKKLSVSMNMLAYDCRNLLEPTWRADGSIHRCDSGDLDEIVDFLDMFHQEVGIDQRDRDTYRADAERFLHTGSTLFWKDGQGNTVACCRWRPDGTMARVSLVYTCPKFRRKHYAENLVYQATKSVMDAGYVPMLYTDADYAASNACYEKIGYVLRGKLCTIG